MIKEVFGTYYLIIKKMYFTLLQDHFGVFIPKISQLGGLYKKHTVLIAVAL